MNYKWLENVAEISDDHTFIKFHSSFNQQIEPNTLPENLLTLIFGRNFNHNLAYKILILYHPNTL